MGQATVTGRDANRYVTPVHQASDPHNMAGTAVVIARWWRAPVQAHLRFVIHHFIAADLAQDAAVAAAWCRKDMWWSSRTPQGTDCFLRGNCESVECDAIVGDYPSLGARCFDQLHDCTFGW